VVVARGRGGGADCPAGENRDPNDPGGKLRAGAGDDLDNPETSVHYVLQPHTAGRTYVVSGHRGLMSRHN